LWELGLNVGKIDFDEGINLLNQKDARVYVQVPTAERSAALGSRVDLKLTLDEKKLAQHRATAEKQAREAAEERLRLERERAALAGAGRIRTGGRRRGRTARNPARNR